ncbi:MAG: HD domain-containing protein [Candidatus Gracilibacteria bacterium]|nr:HD domain-containing protein [Candidatus Gracilibacteria bacterium]
MEKYVNDLYEKLKNEISKYNPKYNKKLIDKAFLYAYKAHKKFFRENKQLYITHPIYTALHLTQLEADDVSIVCALLHDVLDNQDYKLKDIFLEFGEEIGNIIDGINKLGALYFTVDMNKKDIENLKKALVSAGNDIRVFLVKIAGRFHNLETLDFLPKQKRYRIAMETQEIYLPIIDFLSIGEFLTQMHDLCFKYTNESEYKKLNNIFGKKQTEYEKIIMNSHDLILSEFNKSGLKIINVEGRVKSLYSIYKKLKIKDFDINEIYDVLALRIITKDVKDAYIALGIIHKLYKAKSDRFKDYISEPKSNGYQSIHTTVIDENGNFLEFQIQTLEMSKLNKLGIAAHFIYKGFGIDYKNLPEWMRGFIDKQKNSFDQKLFLEKFQSEVIISEIKCYDENGKIIFIPKDSVLIDYAFTYNKEYGIYFLGAYVNGIYTQNPFLILKSGDNIKLEKGNKIFTNYKIENYFSLKTYNSREEIKKIFIKYSKDKLIELGKFILDSSLETYSYRHFQANSIKVKNQTIKSFGLKNENDLYLFIALGSIELENVVKKIISLYTKNELDKKVSLKINLKTKDCNTINNITKLFYELNLSIKEIIYKENHIYILLTFDIDSNSTLNELLLELKRVPNILNVIRIFPLRLKLYYGIYFLILFLLSSIVIFIDLFDFTKYEKTIFLEFTLFGTSFFMLFMLLVIKYIVKTILPDILRYKRFWFSIFLLNTFVFFIIFWELFFLGFSMYFIIYLILFLFSYILFFYEYFIYKKYKN